MYKRLDNGAFRWPRSADEAMSITEDQYRMLMQGLEIVARHPIEELKKQVSCNLCRMLKIKKSKNHLNRDCSLSYRRCPHTDWSVRMYQ